MIVVNAKPGGFGLSREAAAALGLEVDEKSSFMQPYRVIGENALRRNDSRLVDVVETLGQAASGPNAELVVSASPTASTGESPSMTVPSGWPNGIARGHRRRAT